MFVCLSVFVWCLVMSLRLSDTHHVAATDDLPPGAANPKHINIETSFPPQYTIQQYTTSASTPRKNVYGNIPTHP